MQVRAVNASQARLLEPALLWWGSLALQIKAPQTVLFQDEPQSTTSSLEGKGLDSQARANLSRLSSLWPRLPSNLEGLDPQSGNSNKHHHIFAASFAQNEQETFSSSSLFSALSCWVRANYNGRNPQKPKYHNSTRPAAERDGGQLR
jgi:hypothetical protein